MFKLLNRLIKTEKMELKEGNEREEEKKRV